MHLLFHISGRTKSPRNLKRRTHFSSLPKFMDRSNSSSSNSLLCARGCGFYGSAEHRNLCSKCYNDFLKENKHDSVTAKSTSPSHQTRTPTSPTREKNRCHSCSKKVGLMGFRCKCGGLFCGAHRYPQEHLCRFDHKTAGRQVLAKQNPLVKADKLHSRL